MDFSPGTLDKGKKPPKNPPEILTLQAMWVN
jgi:hypothetical protein